MDKVKISDNKEAVPQGPPKIDMKTLDVVVKKVLNYGPTKASRQSKPEKKAVGPPKEGK